MKEFISQCVIVFCLYFSIVFSFAHGELVRGDDCYNEIRKSVGVCKSLGDCPSAQKDLQDHKIEPQRCGFEGTLPIVCCVKKMNLPGEISKQKCEEYGDLVYSEIDIPTFSISRSAVNESECAIQPTFVHGGVDAIPREFPHMALLGFGEESDIKWRCGGSLISEQFVLTAAHCLADRTFGSVRFVHIGDLDITTSDDDADPQDFQVANRFRHPDYIRSSTYNDIALLLLDRPVIFTEYVRPACLHVTYETSPKGYFSVSGWGHLEHNTKKNSPILQKAVIQEYSNLECNKSFEPYYGGRRLKDGVVDGSQICAGGKTNDKDTCPGDSGGPLQMNHPDVFCMYSIVGVTSFGQPRCGVTGIPAIYTRVSNYIEWIESVVWPS